MSATDDLTNQPGHDLALGINYHARGRTVLTGRRLGNQPPAKKTRSRQGHADRLPLGVGAAVATVGEATLAPDELLVLYSDGLIERPGRSLDDGRAALERVASDAAVGRALPTTSASAVERVCRLSVELLTRTGYDDDVTVLAVQRLGEPRPHLSRSVIADTDGITDVVQGLRDWLDGLHLSNEVTLKIELAVNEAVANVAEHAYPEDTPGQLQVTGCVGHDGTAEICIADEGQWREAEGDIARSQGLALMERLVDDMTLTYKQPEHRGTEITLRQSLFRQALIGIDRASTAAERPRSNLFATEQYRGDDAVTLKVMGAVDASNAHRFVADVTEAARGGTLTLAIDLNSVTLLTSQSIRALYAVKDQLAAHQQSLTLIAAPHSPAALVLDLVGLPHTTIAS